MVDFFHMLDAQTLRQSLNQFYRAYPHLRLVGRLNTTTAILQMRART